MLLTHAIVIVSRIRIRIVSISNPCRADIIELAAVARAPPAHRDRNPAARQVGRLDPVDVTGGRGWDGTNGRRRRVLLHRPPIHGHIDPAGCGMGPIA